MSLWEDILDALFPEQCIACGRKGGSLCALCERTIIMRPTMHEEWLTTLFEYHQPIVKKAVQDLKYHHRRGIATYFGNALYREFFSQLSRRPSEVAPIILVPIPGSYAGNCDRGYNHAEEIAKAVVNVAKGTKLPITVDGKILKKSHETRNQAKVEGRGAREKNVEGAFTVSDREHVEGKHIVLIDDVITTGETMSVARAALLKAGAKTVIGIGVAH